MSKNLRWKLILIVVVIGGMGLAAYHMEIGLGLDLRGGAEILYKVHTEKRPEGVVNVMTQTMHVIERRIEY